MQMKLHLPYSKIVCLHENLDPKRYSSVLKEQQSVLMCRHWQGESLTKLAHMSKETC